MAQTIKLKRSGTSGNIPTTSQLELGEVAINTYDGKMFIKKNVGGTESIVEISAAAADAILVEYQFTSTASQTTYTGSDDNSETLSYTPNAIQVFMNGILLDPGIDFTATNGYSIVLAEAADANDYLQIFAFKKKISDGQVSVDTFTGDDSTVAFTLSVDPGDENNTRVFIDGVYQSKANYSVSGTTLTFSTAPPTGTAVEVEIGNRVVTLDTLSDLDLPDNVKLRLGTDQDLQIYHDGSHSYINEQGTGNLYLNTTNGGGVFLTSAGENLALFNSNGAVNLYYDNSAKFATTNDGISVTGDVEATGEIIGDLRGATLFKAQAGEALSKGDVVYISGISGNTTVVSKADADDASKMPAFGLVAAAASSGNPVDIYTAGILADIDTSSFSEGDELFVSTTAGALTATAPTGESAALQKIGKVTRSDATGGRIFIIGAGRSNAVPNLNEGRLFVGNSSNQAVADDTVHVDIANSRVGIGTSSPSQKLDIRNSGSAAAIKLRREDTSDEMLILIGSSYGYVQNTTGPLGLGGSGGDRDLFIATSGNVGINNTNPNFSLDISGADNSQLRLLGTDTNPTTLVMDYNSGGATGRVRIQNDDGALKFTTNNGNVRQTILENGNVGIGTSNPGYPLHIWSDTTIARFGGTDVNDTYLNIFKDNATSIIKVQASKSGSGATNVSINPDGGNVLVGTTSSVVDSSNTNFNMVFPNNGGIAIGSVYTFANIYGNLGNLYLRANAYPANTGSDSTIYLQTGNSAGGQAPDVVVHAGNVGIGTTSPQVDLDIAGTLASPPTIRLTNTTTSFTQGDTTGEIEFYHNDPTDFTPGTMAKIRAIAGPSGGEGSLQVLTNMPSEGADAATVAAHFNSNGNVGIGTASPVSNLHVKTSVDNSVSQGIVVERSANSDRGYINYNGGGFQFRSTVGDPIVFGETDAEHMRIQPDGNVGIGTSSPSYPLDILGSHTVYAGNVATSSTATTSYNVIRFTQGAGSGAPTGMIGTGGSATSNSGFAGAFVVGTQTSAPLTLLTNDAERVRIASDGKVAIGGASAFSGTPENTLSLIHDGHGLGFDYVGATLPRTAGLFTSSSGLTQTAWGDLNIKARTDYGNYYGIGFFTAAANNTPINRMVIKANGNVGIGTTSPGTHFDLVSNTASVLGAARIQYGGANDYEILRLEATTNNDSILSFKSGASYYWGMGVDYSDGGKFKISRDNVLTVNTAITIDSSNNVGIGTVTPAAKLDVQGEIQSTALTLDAIATTTADTAVDVFVYDTRKDSDGGAWRKRTQHTSWYNETLNTSTRGSRREFPAVAVIVSTLTAVRIFDGDDPDLPLWMEFTAGAQGMSGKYMLQYPNNNGFRTYALNGVLVLGEKTNTDNWGSPIINFISEKVVRADPQSNEGGTWLGNIADRNSGVGYIASNEGYITVNSIVDDVAMKVLPNAPIDETTGLPIPTIALATPGGVSVIRHDGSVVDITAGAGASYNGVSWVDFTENNHLIFEQDNSSRAVFCIPIPTSDRTTQTNDGSIQDKVILKWYATDQHSPYPVYNGTGVVEGVLYEEGDGQALIGSNGELTLLKPDFNSPEQGRVCYIGEDYNTGWMTGDSKLAVFSDTDDTNITGSELVTNGTFDSNVSNWTATNSTIALDTNRMEVTRSGGTGVCVYQAITTEVGKTYTVSAQIDSVGSRGDLMVLSGLVGTGTQLLYLNGTLSSAVYVSGSFTATTTTTYIYFNVDSDGTRILVDDVSCRVAELDRSMYGQSGQIFNTLVKTPVATGAELVSYNLSSNDGYLAIPSFKGAPGSGDFAISFWIKPVSSDSSYFHIFSLGTSSVGGQSSNNGFVLKAYGTSNGLVPYFYNNDGTTSKGTYDEGVYFPYGKWTHVVGMRRGGTPYIYVNGVLRTTGTSWTGSLTDTFLTIGRGLTHTGELNNDSELALLRFSKTAPTSEEIEKMYTSEKALFATNAKATLYGASTATAVAYDEDTGLLHVGTSAGRSVFQGLVRVENTTDAVGTTISASNGFVAED